MNHLLNYSSETLEELKVLSFHQDKGSKVQELREACYQFMIQGAIILFTIH